MSYHREMFLKEQAEIEAAKEKQHADNLKKYEELDNTRPTPSPDDIRKAMGLPPREEPVVEEAKAEPKAEPKADDKPEDDKPVEDKVEKTSTAEPSGAQYKTRDARAAKK